MPLLLGEHLRVIDQQIGDTILITVGAARGLVRGNQSISMSDQLILRDRADENVEQLRIDSRHASGDRDALVEVDVLNCV